MMEGPIRVKVYIAKCLVDGSRYVGITAREVPERWREHLSDARGKNAYKKALTRAIRLHGPQAFEVEEVCIAFGVENACVIERHLISEYRTEYPAGYNLSNGGEGSVGRVLSPLVRDAIREKIKALWADPDYRKRMERSFKARAPSPASHAEHLRALAAMQRGRPRSAASVEKGRVALLGHQVSYETRAKIGAKSVGRKRSAESLARQAESMRLAHAARRAQAAAMVGSV